MVFSVEEIIAQDKAAGVAQGEILELVRFSKIDASYKDSVCQKVVILNGDGAVVGRVLSVGFRAIIFSVEVVATFESPIREIS